MFRECSYFFNALGAVLLVGVAIGYFGSSRPSEAEDRNLELRDRPYLMPERPGTYLDNMMSGGPPKDGIPSIDNPKFISAKQAAGDLLAPGDIVIGYEKSGEAKAYPQKILVQHEIVNEHGRVFALRCICLRTSY